MKKLLIGLLVVTALGAQAGADEVAIRQQSVVCSATNNPEAASTSFFRKHSRAFSTTFVGAGSLLASWIIISMMRRQRATGD